MVDMREFLKKWWPSVLIALLATVATKCLFCWGYDDVVSNTPQRRDEIIRNYGLLIATCWGASLAMWRSQIASEQVKISNHQAESALRQAETPERGLRNERFQKSADMLGSRVFAVRIGGVHTLERLALDYPESYLNQIIKLLAAFVRYPVPDAEMEERIKEVKAQSDANGLKFREDVAEAVRVIGDLNSNKIPAHDKPDPSF